MRNKYVLIVASAIILALLVVGIIVKKNPQDTTTEPETEEPEQEDEENDQESDEENENNEENQEESTPLGPFGKFKQEGEQCLEVEDTIERGDCFQEAGENYLDWNLNEEKDEFYFSYQHDQDHWNDVFYKEIDEDDQLSDIIEAEYFDEYDDPYAHRTEYERGEKLLDEYWYVFSNLIPKKNREMLKYLYWRDTEDDVVFTVGIKDDDIESMYLTFPHMLPHDYHAELRHTLIHEYGHLLTLNKTQLNIDEEFLQNDDFTDEKLDELDESCGTIFAYVGCAKEDSYIYSYYERFWSDIDDRHQKIDWENDHEYEEFFFDYEERFFNSYQGTSLAEDIADMFSFFVHSHSSDRENPEMKYEKIDFFYEYDELVELRTTILESLYKLSVEDRKYY